MTADNWFRLLSSWMGLPALAVLTALLVYRRWYRAFPFFLVYVIGAEVIGLIRLVASSTVPPRLYARIYWSSDTLLAVLALVTTYELFFKLLFPKFYKIRFYRYLFPIAAILVAFLAMLVAFLGGRSSLFITTVRVYEFLRAIILFFFVALMLVMGRRWSRQEFGIAFGFGLDGSTSLVLIGAWSHSALRNVALGRLSVLAYDAACLMWLYCFWPAPDVPVIPESVPPEKLAEARRSEEVLKDFLTSSKPKP